ncbi:hypothetical protein DPMN_133476 [Dreissena polymorpha]|uniref:Uncharacterized protein n=1 Tax=Dreissena polymorpha TaxID=45954 RepID=A0A9D4FUC6_DREPO|nr:hypothetical protein DPMN_133476 [Dreissena polymorpha]
MIARSSRHFVALDGLRINFKSHLKFDLMLGLARNPVEITKQSDDQCTVIARRSPDIRFVEEVPSVICGSQSSEIAVICGSQSSEIAVICGSQSSEIAVICGSQSSEIAETQTVRYGDHQPNSHASGNEDGNPGFFLHFLGR